MFGQMTEERPKPSLVQQCVKGTWAICRRYSHAAVSATTLIVLLYIAAEASQTLHDVSEVVPQVHTSLDILYKICNTDLYRQYCGDEL
jgi:hypothetical protein